MSAMLDQIEKLVQEGRFLEARSRSERLLKQADDDARLMQLLALSMAKSGASKAAMDLLDPVYREHPDDPETCGILGSIYKDLFKETKNSKYALLSRDTYLNNYRLTGNYYTGINAASMYAISGSISKAKEIARELIAQLNPSATDVWGLATLAEAYLLLRENDKAVQFYLKCRYLIASDWWKITSIYNQLWLLNHYIPVSTQIMSIFSPPAVAAFIGHMIDHPARELSRFPSSIEPQIKQAIRIALQSVNAKIGYCSMACGSDILFAEAMAESGGEVNLFLPFNEDDFLETSVSFAGENWLQRFNDLKSRFAVNHVTTERYMGDDDLFSFQSQVIFGSALQRAALLHSSPHLITVFSDVDVLTHLGGTYDTIKFWPEDQKRININPQHYISNGLPTNRTKVSPPRRDDKAGSRNRHVRFMVCIAFPGYTIEQQHRLDYHINKKIQEMAITHYDRNENSLLFAFKTIEDAATLAWALMKTAPVTAGLKVTLHAGPVITEDGVSKIIGAAADIARSLNTHSPAGKAYSSFQFASLLALQSDRYAVEYAGIIQAAGHAMSVFQVNRHADAFDVT